MSNGQNIRLCEWQDCGNEGRYRIQTTASKDDIHWFCHLHVRMFDLGVVAPGSYINGVENNWTQNKAGKNQTNQQHTSQLNSSVRLRHVSKNKTLNYTKEDLENLKTLGLETGAIPDDIKKAYKTLVKHCHPDQNPNLENAILIFEKVNEAYNALKDKDFS
ncbi:MAG: J domain-containing protein [Kordiimonadaceae bacterium]|jgi:hypothetical protein|nr:J domain-containing protein [Kordiimonadaceae bacterium]